VQNWLDEETRDAWPVALAISSSQKPGESSRSGLGLHPSRTSEQIKKLLKLCRYKYIGGF
jgi:hypothetical protein